MKIDTVDGSVTRVTRLQLRGYVAIAIASVVVLGLLPSAGASGSGSPVAADARNTRVPVEGATFNDPSTPGAPQNRIINYLNDAIRQTPKGETIRITQYNLTCGSTVREIIRAHKRGVHIQIVLNDRVLGNDVSQRPLYKRLKRMLGKNPNRNDTSVTAFIVMMLKDAKVAGIPGEYKKAFAGIRNWFKKSCSGKHGGLGSYSEGRPEPTPTMTAIVMLCNQFMGMRREDPSMKESAKYLSKVDVAWPKTREEFEAADEKADRVGYAYNHLYFIYYGSLAMFQYGGDKWKQWNKQMKKALMDNQIKGGCADGSWPCFNGREAPFSLAAEDRRMGKVYPTCLAILSLEVYYRYSPLFRASR